MNLLQSFMAECNRQTRTINQEAVTITQFGATQIMGSFGDAQMIPEMLRQGYQDQIVYAFIASADQFTTPPTSRQKLTRAATGVEYFIQMVDPKDPVVYTFILTDREA